MKIGDRKAVLRQESCGQEGLITRRFEGVVTYIHPLHRFYVVRLDVGYSEAFAMIPEVLAADRWQAEHNAWDARRRKEVRAVERRTA